MTEKQKDELLKHVVGAIGAIKAQFEVEVIKDYEIPPLVNTKTMQDIGFGVKLQLNTRYDYDEEMLTQWKNMLKADEWYISVKRNQLHVTFKVRYKEDWRMKADELMVGDIVLRKGKPVEIVSTSGIEYSFGQQDITIYQGKGNGLESHTMRGVAPMRMSEKLLLAIGFGYGVSPNEWVYEDSEKRIDICVDHTELDHWWVCVRHGHSKQTDNFQYFEGFADYLHLFQHILRCCCIDIGICYDKVKDL